MATPEQLSNARGPRVPVPSLDLLRSFAAATALPLLRFQPNIPEDQEIGDGDLELNLGLSLNGRFGVDPGSSKLVRSASISDVKNTLGASTDCHLSKGLGSDAARTCSLPVESKGYGKRKDVTTGGSLGEARRRRIEKPRDVVPCKTDYNSGVSARNGLIGSPPNRGCEEASNGCDQIGMTGQWMALRKQLLSQLSQRRASLESKCLETQGTNNDTATRSLMSTEPSQVKVPNTPGISRQRSTALASEKCDGVTDDASEEGKRMMKFALENMPCVSAKGSGPNGKKVEGFLYRYRKGEEEVRIMCVCHGSLFTPAEFVKHAGLGDVAHPLKHIVVNTSPTL